ncbi:MAG: MBL fold metallo-hydrolase [Deltaproteobacteria bacterium]|jgi:alkyl sulfatase BDS1-like metallo-beta-lactamase superfamily hydrolase|nr:MBL fold metallo-hydrolase [Deltaproteobacteria bacterium]MBT4642483.1 MBL fold metallo-hydrolase [Deltaproteobacteria bacterium]MBT6501505.1 MBL fold metallo-hydrolase [Deltaproteobacteria bacterium]MBT6613273.1 MBL fold metallo-hydrolase [Deltaproteobacteria bacterium]MBT7711325.1 MBL fold metallo-hydrolase [Deltaproteobacteria bacterium]
MAGSSDNSSNKKQSGLAAVLHGEVKARTCHPGVHILGGMGNTTAFETEQGYVLIDAGFNEAMAAGFMQALQEIKAAPIHSIVYSHGHAGYNNAAWYYQEMASEKGEPAPQIVAHKNLPLRYQRYDETWQLQHYLNGMQFRMSFDGREKTRHTYPTVTFQDRLRLNLGNRAVEVIWAPSETDDSVAVWLPDEKVLYTGPAVIAACINIGTPLRTQRDDKRWVKTLENFAALEPEVLIPNFGKVIKGKDEIQFMLNNMAEGLRYLRREVTERMNRHMTDVEILHDIEYPAEYFEQPWSAPLYGCPDMIVRDIYRSENGWWDRNPTNLHPAHPGAAASAVLAAISDRKAVLDKAENLMEAGEVQLALHVIDILALAPDDDDDVKAAKKLKSKLLHLRSKNVPSIVSSNLYLSLADSLDKELES